MYDHYYTNQLIEYNNNYNSAIKKIDALSNKIKSLQDTIKRAKGTEVESIKSDLSGLIDKLTNTRMLIMDTLCSSNDRASACSRCYFKYKNNADYNNVGIDEYDGRVYGMVYVPDQHQYSDPSVIEIILGISTARAEGSGSWEQHKASIEEMLSS